MFGVGRKCKTNEQSVLFDEGLTQHVFRILSFDSERLTVSLI